MKRMTMLLVSATILGPTTAARAVRPPAEEVAIFGAGCYWSSEAVFEHLKGVKDVVAGFAVPAAGSGSSAHASHHASYAEAARVTYDPSRITYRQLLEVFFLAAHDPTEIERQGPDVGPQYRSVVFVSGDAQRRAALAYIDELTAGHQFRAPIATEVVEARSFSPAPDQDFVARNPGHPYVVQWDRPKLAELHRRFPALMRD
jgi:peptide-methionine (S)-S-oxide reductase